MNDGGVELCQCEAKYHNKLSKTIVTVQNLVISQISHRDKKRKKQSSRQSNDKSNKYVYIFERNANNYGLSNVQAKLANEI